MADQQEEMHQIDKIIDAPAESAFIDTPEQEEARREEIRKLVAEINLQADRLKIMSAGSLENSLNSLLNPERLESAQKASVDLKEATDRIQRLVDSNI